MTDRTYLCIDLKSFYASVECVERGLDAMTTKLVVADPERTNKTICLAVSPAMKKLGIKNRCRVFQIPGNVKYIMAEPRMKLYIEYSANIYGIYLKYISKDDIHVYSIDEAFMDVTNYLKMYGMTAKELAVKIMQDVYETYGITATCGIGTNLYLAKIALDITAKHVDDNIGILTEEDFRRTLWNHRPLTDFWRIGSGTAKRLEKHGIYTMKQIAEADEDMLYKTFGIDAELLIDHAWGREITTIADIKVYKPKSSSLTSGQVLERNYGHEEGKIIVKEMADLLCLELVDKGLVTNSVFLYLGYSNELGIEGARGTASLQNATSSAKTIIQEVTKLYERIKDKRYPIRRVNISFNNLMDDAYEQYDLFVNPMDQEKEKKMQKAMIGIKKKYGKNMVLKGMNLVEGAKTIERNKQIGGHKSGE